MKCCACECRRTSVAISATVLGDEEPRTLREGAQPAASAAAPDASKNRRRFKAVGRVVATSSVFMGSCCSLLIFSFPYVFGRRCEKTRERVRQRSRADSDGTRKAGLISNTKSRI